MTATTSNRVSDETKFFIGFWTLLAVFAKCIHGCLEAIILAIKSFGRFFVSAFSLGTPQAKRRTFEPIIYSVP